jgi:hypothetical protein
MDAVHKDHRQGQGQGSQIRSLVVQSPQGNQKPKCLERSRLQQSSSQPAASQISQRARTFSHGPFRRPQPVDLGPFKDRGRLAQVGPATQTGGSGGMLRKGGLKEAKKHEEALSGLLIIVMYEHQVEEWFLVRLLVA